MVTAYLEKLKEEFLQEKKTVEKKIQNLQMKLKENEKVQKMLTETEDFNYELFTPRVTNPENKERIKELKKQKEDILFSIKEQQKRQEQYIKKIDELDNVIKQVSDPILLWNKESVKKTEDTEHNELYRIHLLETQENERQRISRELHDDTVQNLTSLVHKTELCSKLVDTDPVRCKLELASMTKFLHDIITDTREIIYDLRPMSFDDIGFDVTVARALDKLELQSFRKLIHFKVEGESYQLQSVIGITILRIIQEACSNALCHANPTYIHVLLRYEPEQIYFEIVDNGYGFDLEKTMHIKSMTNSGFGLAMMKERVFLLSGKIEIESEIGVGTSIKINVPIEKEV